MPSALLFHLTQEPKNHVGELAAWNSEHMSQSRVQGAHEGASQGSPWEPFQFKVCMRGYTCNLEVGNSSVIAVPKLMNETPTDDRVWENV